MSATHLNAVLSNLTDLVDEQGQSEKLSLVKSPDKGGFTIFERTGVNKRRKLYIKTPLLLCSTGLEDNNCVKLQLTTKFYEDITNFEQWLKYHLLLEENDVYINKDTDLAQVQDNEEDHDDIYRTLIHTGEEEHVNVFLDTRSKVFDRDNQRVQTDKYNEYLSGRFSCTVALELSNVSIFAGKVQIKPHIFQLKVYSFSLLPSGCTIFHDIGAFTDFMEQRGEQLAVDTTLAITSYSDAVEDFNPDINELMD